jgi:hypothetical protein
MSKNKLKENGIIAVAIIETDVYGAKAYHAHCLTCGWECKRKDKEDSALRIGKNHRCKK